MLQPKHYPEMLGKALVFEADPFITMVEDDNPWAEGLFLVITVGILVGVAQIAGVLLTSAILPEPDALLAALLQISDHISKYVTPAAAGGPTLSESLRILWPITSITLGFSWSWLQLGWLILAPFLLVIQWLLYGLVTHFIARALGGRGELKQTLGAVALMVAPQIFVLLEIVPFASVSMLLLWVWATLIVYRATEVSHGLGWRKSAAVAATAPALLLLLAFGAVTLIAIVGAIAGGAA